MKLIIQIPCYNEEETLPLVLAELPKTIPGIDIIETQIIDSTTGNDENGPGIWLDNGNCNNPPPDWAPANGWRARCEGQSQQPGGNNSASNGNPSPPGQQNNPGQGQNRNSGKGSNKKSK